MLYLGGKGRIGKDVASTILRLSPKRDAYLEPFLGGGSAFKHLAPCFGRVFAGDVHQDLMLMWDAAARGWQPPSAVSEAEYKEQRRVEPSPLRGFTGFGCSFGGKWWGGYARSKQNGDDYYARHAHKSVLEIAKLMPPHVDGELRQASFDTWQVNANYLVYADPPYAGTTKYKGGFDHEWFWSVMNRWVEIGADVFVSEYSAPVGWTVVWEKEQRRKVSGGTGEMTSEKLFTRYL